MLRIAYSSLATVLLALAACGGGGKAGEEFVGKLEKIKAEACACKDAACAEAIGKKLDAWENEIEAKFKSEKDVDTDVLKKLGKLDDEIRDCRKKARGAAGGDAPAPTPAPTPAADPAAAPAADPAAAPAPATP